MATKIHPTAIVESGAKLADGVEIGAYCYIGGEVEIGENCVIEHHATVDGFTKMGANNRIFPYAFVGGKTHDLKFKGGKPGLLIGSSNVFREYVTVHMATADATFTKIGDNNFFLAYGHIAHDCIVENNVILSAHAALGGHVQVKNHAVIGWGSGVHQFCRVGDYAMLSAASKSVKDIPPFMMADGSPAAVCAINKLNMQRNNFSEDEINAAYFAFKTIYRRGLSRKHAFDAIAESPYSSSKAVAMILSFAEQSGERSL